MRTIDLIAFGEPPDLVANRLISAGWNVQVAIDLASMHRLLRSVQPPHVCLLLLCKPQASLLPEIEACVRVTLNAEWVGAFGPDVLRDPYYRELVLNYFFDYHTLPANLDHLAHTVGHAYGRTLLRAENESETRVNAKLGMVGESAGMMHLRRQIAKIAPNSAPVLISGESGTGKELAAQAIHRSSMRNKGPFIAVNCGAITPTLIQSELFGHERGSFTGAQTERRGLIEAAHGGTVFLDEIGDLSLDLQANLLRFLQEKTITRVGSTRSLHVDVRVVAASHVNLEKAVSSGRFREDLFYRLNVLTLKVLPLRERKEDIPMLAQHFFERCMEERLSRLHGFSRQAIAAMLSYEWPGNVRELFNCVQRAVVMTDRRRIGPADLGIGAEGEPAQIEIGLEIARTRAERDAIHLSLQRVGHNVSQAARDLGVSRMTLYRLMDKHRIAPNMK